MTNRYSGIYRDSLDNPDTFWMQAADLIDWASPPATAFSNGTWFPGAQLNTCHNAVDRHVEAGHTDRTALIWDSPVTGQKRKYSFQELRDEVAKTAGMIRDCNAKKGDRVLIFMPMIPEAVFAMLACARIGAVHSVVFGGFAATELAKRIDDAQPVLILAASCGFEPSRVVAYKPLLDQALDIAAHNVDTCIIYQREGHACKLLPGRDKDWQDARARAIPADCVDVRSDDPLYILYTSGTSGNPKGVVRDNGGHAVALTWSMENIYGIKSGEVFWAASDIGWVVGHSYIVYGPLLNGCTTVLYEGKPVGTPDASAFWRVIREHNVSVFFTAPTAIRSLRREDPEGGHLANGIGSLRTLFLAGERADPDTIEWAQEKLGVPVVDHWWQTELGWPAVATCIGLGQTEVEVGSSGFPVPGFEIAVLDKESDRVGPNTVGEIAICSPLPPGCLLTLWRNQEGHRNSYLDRHPGYYSTGDAGFIDENGRVHIMSRIDDLINVAGHRLSTGQIEEIIAGHEDVTECAVVAAPDKLKGEVPFAFVVLGTDCGGHEARLCAELIERVRQSLGPVASFKLVVFVSKLPKTRSGKILRGTVRKMLRGDLPEIPQTIEDVDAIEVVREVVLPFMQEL